MDLPWGDERTKQFATNIGLITSNGPYGYNIMAAEWTHQLSYSPGLIGVSIDQKNATHSNIIKKKVFGVNLCAYDQNILSSISGGSSGKLVDKIGAIKELGFEFFKAKKIDVLMVKGASMQAECKLIRKIIFGDHTTFVGEVIELYPAGQKEPLILYHNKYWKVGDNIPRPQQQEMIIIKGILEKHKKDNKK